jgi:hypothetical protein
MDALRLRTLTKKSVLGFGKYSDLTVMHVLNSNHTRYLRWVYYNCDMISFMDDILEEIRIPETHRIEKPGKNPEMHEELNDLIESKMPGFNRFKMKSHQKRVTKGVSASKMHGEKRNYTKGSMQAANQGHKKMY